jgi:hypothetical protein
VLAAIVFGVIWLVIRRRGARTADASS